MKIKQPCRIIFITGTDTGVGKSVLTGLLLAHLRRSGCRALAMKPFCSGGLGDVNLLRGLQDRELSAEEINPFFFEEPVAPLVAARKHHRWVPLAEVIGRIHPIANRCKCLLVEGAGGLLVPLGEDRKAGQPRSMQPYTTLDLIRKLGCETIVVSRNKLGTINHTLLTVRAIQEALGKGVVKLKTVLMQTRNQDVSAASNAQILEELLHPVPFHALPFLGPGCAAPGTLKQNAARLKRTLDQIICR